MLLLRAQRGRARCLAFKIDLTTIREKLDVSVLLVPLDQFELFFVAPDRQRGEKFLITLTGLAFLDSRPN